MIDPEMRRVFFLLICWSHVRSTYENGIAPANEVDDIVRQSVIVPEVRVVVSQLGSSNRGRDRSDVDIFRAVSVIASRC